MANPPCTTCVLFVQEEKVQTLSNFAVFPTDPSTGLIKALRRDEQYSLYVSFSE